MKHLNQKSKTWIVISMTVIALIVTFMLPVINQDPSYHNFADKRSCFGIPNFVDVVSNALFAVVGILGFRVVRHANAQRMLPESYWSYLIFFIGVGLTSFGSAYYHLAPDNARLVWDRLPMTFGFMAFLSAMISERLSAEAGKYLLVPLLIIGATSVFYWYISESRGHGDLRFYLYLVQAYPLFLVMIMIILFRPEFSHGRLVIISLLIYASAKIAEYYDYQILSFHNLISGHTLKHILAGLSVYVLIIMLNRRFHFQSPDTSGQ